MCIWDVRSLPLTTATMEDWKKEEPQKKKKKYRKRSAPPIVDEEAVKNDESNEERQRRMALEKIKLVQKQRERKSGIPANPLCLQAQSGIGGGLCHKKDGDGSDKDELLITFAQETPNMVRYIEFEHESAKKRDGKIDATDQVQNDLKRAQHKIPKYNLKKKNTEAAKKLLQEKRLMGLTKSKFSIHQVIVMIISSVAEILLKNLEELLTKNDKFAEQPELYDDRNLQDDSSGSKQNDSSIEAAGGRQAATDELMLERFRKQKRYRVMGR